MGAISDKKAAGSPQSARRVLSSQEILPTMSESDTYLTLDGPGTGIYKEKGSRFLAFAYPAADEEEAKALLAQLRKQYYDARHVCYAYAFGRNGAVSRANDDGEPGHSAGTPILGQIRSRELTDVLVAVVRYFGGTKLGVGGLVQAYKTAAAEALDQAPKAERHYAQILQLAFDYPQMNAVMKVVKDHSLEVLSQDFQLRCQMALRVRESLLEPVLASLDGHARILPSP
jgi:uncharacterized YigZ family protein